MVDSCKSGAIAFDGTRRKTPRLSLSFICISIILAAVLFCIGAFGDFALSGTVQRIIAEKEIVLVEQERKEEAIANSQKSESKKITHKNKDEIIGNYSNKILADIDKNNGQNADLVIELNDEEAFLYAIIMLDLFSLGYDVFLPKLYLRKSQKFMV